jgi:heterodisulfide reductase subunit A
MAIQLPCYTDDQIAADIGDSPQTVVFACENSAYPAATAAACNGKRLPSDYRLVRVPCAGKVDSRQVLEALHRGASKVLILGCHVDNCQYIVGSTYATKRIEHIRANLKKLGVDANRVSLGRLASVEPGKFIEYVSA